MINYQLSCQDYFFILLGIICFAQRFVQFYSVTVHNSNLSVSVPPVPNFYLNFFSCQYIFSCCLFFGKYCFKSAKYHQNEVLSQMLLTVHTIFEQGFVLYVYQLIFLHICCLHINSFAFLHIFANQKQKKKRTIVTPKICCKIKHIVLSI